MLPLVFWRMYWCVCVFMSFNNNKFAANIKQICRKREAQKYKIKRAAATTKLIQFQV